MFAIHQERAAATSGPFLVELPGIEPGSYGIPSRLLRAQFAMPLLGSPGHANKPGWRSQSLLVSRWVPRPNSSVDPSSWRQGPGRGLSRSDGL